MKHFYRMVALLIALCASPVGAQDKKPGDGMIEKYLAAQADQLAQKFLDGATTLAEWQQKRPRLQREYLDMLGLWPLPEKTPLEATVTGQLEKYGVIVEKLHYQCKPGLYVTANLYRPKTSAKKLPAILYVCGHSGRGRDGNKTAFQDHGFWFANNGYVCLIVDTLQLGEIAGIHHGTYGIRRGKDQVETRFWWHSAGYTPAGVECWNGVRGIDYLLTRPEVDPERIGVTGISGGGAATFWVACADERVKVAVPVSGMSDLESYVKNKVINGHCDCMFLYNTYQWDWTTIAALVAPRPMLFANSDDDKIFPMDGNRRIIAKLRKLYQMYGQPDLVDEYVSAGGHAYRPDLRIVVFKFLNKHLKGDTTTPVEDSAQYAEIPGKELRVFPEDSDIPKDALNARIDETFVPRAKVELPAEGKFAEWQGQVLSRIRERCFKIPNSIMMSAEPGGVHGVIKGGTARQVIIIAEPELYDRFSPFDTFVQKYLNRGEESWDLVWPRSFANIYRIPLKDRWRDDWAWTRKSPPNFAERAHVLLGYSLDELKLYRLISAARYRDTRIGGAGRVEKIVGVGEPAALAAYAALLEPALFREILLIDPPKSHKDGPHFLGVLRVLDIPEALGLLAPRPLTIIGGNDPAFDRTAEIYRRAGAADKLTRK